MCDRTKGTCESLQISVLVEDLDSCIQSLNHTQECLYKSHYEEVIKEGRYQLLSIIRQIKERNCRKPSLVPKDDIERDIFLTEMECEHEETKIDHVRKEWIQQQGAMAKLQEHLYRKCRLLSLHSRYSSTQGSSLCAILAVLMENPVLVEAYLSDADTYLKNFIKIADGCLFSFVKTYAHESPMEDSTDYRYIISLYKCILPISNSPRGRQFLIQREECRNMISAIIYIIPHIKYSAAKPLKIILLKILHNLTNDPDGLKFLRASSEILSTLDDLIQEEYDPESYRYALELLEFITREIPNKECIDKLTNTINTTRLKELSGQLYREVNNVPRKIFQNIRVAADKILAREQEQAQGDILRSKSGDVCKCTSNKSIERDGKHSQQKMYIPQEMAQKRSSRPSSSQSCSSRISTANYGASRAITPTRIPRPISRSADSHKPVGLCSTPCKYLFPGSSCSCRPQFSKDHPSNIPIRTSCIPTCNSRSGKREKKTNNSTSGSRVACRRPEVRGKPSSRSKPESSTERPSSCCSRPSSNERPSSGSRFNYIKDKIIELASSASRKLRSFIQSSPAQASCTTTPSSCTKGGRSKIPTRQSGKPSYSKLSPGTKKTPCSCTTKNKNMVKTPPSKTCSPHCSYKCKRRKVVTPPSWKDSPKPSKNRCCCVTTKAKATSANSKQKIPYPSPSEAEAIQSPASEAKAIQSPTSETEAIKSPASEVKAIQSPTSEAEAIKSPASEAKAIQSPASEAKAIQSPASEAEAIQSPASEAKVIQSPASEAEAIQSPAKQAASDLEYKKPTRTVCSNKSSSPILKYTISFSKSNGNKRSSELPSPGLNETESSIAVPICGSPLGTANTSSPPSSSPSIATECEDEICTCGSLSERRLVPWTPENQMISRLGEIDRRVLHRGQNTIRIVSRIENNVSGRTPRVIARIRIPGLRFQRVVVASSQRKK